MTDSFFSDPDFLYNDYWLEHQFSDSVDCHGRGKYVRSRNIKRDCKLAHAMAFDDVPKHLRLAPDEIDITDIKWDPVNGPSVIPEKLVRPTRSAVQKSVKAAQRPMIPKPAAFKVSIKKASPNKPTPAGMHYVLSYLTLTMIYLY